MSRRHQNFPRIAKPASLTCFGTWIVTLRTLNDDWELEIDETLGVFTGFVDDITLTLHEGMREETVLYFEQAPDEVDPLTVRGIDTIPAEPEFACFDVISGPYRLGLSTADMREFFRDRPVYATHTTWGNCGTLRSTTTPEGAYSKQQADLVESAVSKLSAAELQAMARNGFKRYPESDYVRDYPRDEIY